MNALNLVAEATAGGLWGGGYGVVIAVSVTHSDGTKVKNLKASNFKVHFLPTSIWQGAPQFTNNMTIETCAEKPPGFYVLFVDISNSPPPLPATNKKFIYSVEVDLKTKSGNEHGQTLTSLHHVEVV